MVIAQVISSEAVDVAPMDYDHMVHQIVPKTANPPFGDSVLPRAAVASAYGRNPGRAQKPLHVAAELRVSIEDQVLLVCVFGLCFARLLHDPFAGGVLSHIPVDDLSAIVPNQEQAVEYPEVCRDHGEKIRPGNQIPVIPQKRSPLLSSPVAAMQPRKVSGDGSLGNLEPELQ